jgi:hypothetical protein
MCAIAKGSCTGANSPWSNDVACLADCGALDDLGTFSVDSAFAMYKGTHVQCRLFHVSASALQDPGVHCPHTGGAPPCAEKTSR